MSPPEVRLPFSNETFDGLAERLRELAGECDEPQRMVITVLLHWLTDPIERLKMQPSAVQFSAEEEAILQAMLEKGSAR